MGKEKRRRLKKMIVYKIKCLKCKEFTSFEKSVAVFKLGCPLCNSRKVEIIGCVKEGD